MKKEMNKGMLTILMLLSMVTWGVSWPANKIITAFGTTIDLGIFRYVFVVLSLLLLLLILKTPLKINKKGWVSLLCAGGLMAIYNFTFLQGLKVGSPGKGGILVTTLNPIFAYGLGLLIHFKKPKLNETIGLGLGLIAGLILLKIWSNVDLLLNGGNIYFLSSAFIWAVMSKFTAKSANYGSPFAFSWWMYLLTLVFLLPFGDFEALQKMCAITEMKFWGNLSFAAVITTTLATTMYFFATSKIGAEKASSFIFTVPLSAAFFSWWILDEKIETHTIIGGLIGILAVWVINMKFEKAK